MSFIKRRQPALQSGFTLIEITLVMAISSLLLLIVFTGQRELRDRARFDESIAQAIQAVAYVRNFAQSNVNGQGHGNNTNVTVCGAAIEADSSHAAGKLIELEPIYSNSGDCEDNSSLSPVPSNPSANCPHLSSDGECFEQFFDTPASLLFDSGVHEAEVLYINTGHGMMVCGAKNTSLGDDEFCNSSRNSQLGHNIDLPFTDSNGFKATIRIDPDTGYAKRL